MSLISVGLTLGINAKDEIKTRKKESGLIGGDDSTKM